MINEILAPGVVSFNVNRSLLNKILDGFKSCDSDLWEPSKIISEAMSNTPPSKTIRNSDAISLKNNFPDLNKQLEFEISNILFEYRINYSDSDIHINSREDFTGLRYSPGGYYNIHSDTSKHMYRTVSCLVYLNPEEYEGGETFFKYFNLNYKPSKPTVLIFPSAYIYAHSAMPVFNGNKYAITNWYSDLNPIHDEFKSYSDISILNKENLVEIDGDKYFKIPKRRHNGK
jgi:hypothetical protein